MAMFPAFLDTCTQYGAYLCDSLLRLAEVGTYRPLWSADVLDELERALVVRGLEKKAVTHRIGEMRRAFQAALDVRAGWRDGQRCKLAQHADAGGNHDASLHRDRPGYYGGPLPSGFRRGGDW